MLLIMILHYPRNYYRCSLLEYRLYMVLVNIIHILYTNSIHVLFNIRGHFKLYSLQLLYNVHYTYYACST